MLRKGWAFVIVTLVALFALGGSAMAETRLDLATGDYYIDRNGEYIVTTSSVTAHTLTVLDDVTATITLDNVQMETEYDCISIADTADVTLKLKGTSNLTSTLFGGVCVNGGKLRITSDSTSNGTLNIVSSDVCIGSADSDDFTGSIVIDGHAIVNATINAIDEDRHSAAIGAGLDKDLSGSIWIGDYATVTARGCNDGSGIGTSDDGNFSGSITITDYATVNAYAGIGTSDDGGSGIGSADDGDFTSDASITISGNATVFAQGYDEGCGIGAGDGEFMYGTITIEDSAHVTAYGGDQAAAIGSDDNEGMFGTIAILDIATVVTGMVDEQGNLAPDKVGRIGDGEDLYHEFPNGTYRISDGATINGISCGDVKGLEPIVNYYIDPDTGATPNLTIVPWIPATGDNSQPMLYLALLAISCAGLIAWKKRVMA